ncbi:MAG: TonB-dependent receptor [Gemmatimonadota bacterium]
MTSDLMHRLRSAVAAALVLLAAGAPGLAAQRAAGSVEGRVVDQATGRPVTGARVELSDGSARALTGADGAYSLSSVAAGRRSLVVSAQGYGRALADVDVVSGAAPARRDVALAPSALVLDEVVVTGTAAPTRVRAVPNAVSVITARQIEERGITRVEELFRGDVPGLFSALHPSGGQSGAILVRLYSRGSTNLETNASPPKIYVDNVLVTDAAQLVTLDPESIERIEFVPGPQASTIYGSGAINGVMQVFLKKGSYALTRPRVTATVSGGTVENSFDSRRVSEQDHRAAVQGSTGNTSYTFSASYGRVGEWIPGRVEERVGVDGGVRMAMGPLTAELTGRWGRFEYDGFSRPYEAREIREGTLRLGAVAELLGVGTLRRRTQQTVGLNLAYAPVSWWHHRLTVGRDDRRGLQQNPATLFTFGDTLVQVTDEVGTATTASYRTTAEFPLRGPVKPTLTLGADYTGNSLVLATSSGPEAVGSFTGQGVSSTRFDDPTQGYFAQAQVGLWERVFLTGGLRAEDNPNFGEDYGLSWAPRVGASVVQSLGPATARLRAAYGRATNPPRAGARVDRYTTNFLGINYQSQQGNPEIGPEEQRGGELGLDLEVGSRASVQVTRFRQTAKDLIGQVTATVVDSAVLVFGFPFTYDRVQFVNLGRVRNDGWELQGTAALGPFTARGTYSTVNSRVLRVINPRDPRYRVGDALFGPAQRSGALDLRYHRDRLRLGTHLSYVGPARMLSNAVLEKERTSLRVDRLSRRTYSALPYATSAYTADGYRLLDLNAAYDLRPDAGVFLNVFNALDHYRGEVDNYAVVPGRRMLAGVRFAF